MADPLRLVLTSFPQHWDGKGTLTLNVVLLPTVDPLPNSLIGPSSPSFAKGTPTFVVIINPGLASLPVSTGSGILTLTPTVVSPPATPVATFGLLQSAVTAVGATLAAPPALSIPKIRKALPPSYLAAGGTPPDGNLTTTEDDFGCAIRGAKPTPILSPPLKTLTWGQVISYAMRQPVLAQKLGLFYQLSITLPATNANAFVGGAYVFAALAAADPWAVAATTNPGSIRTHAARIPQLDATPRSLFAALEFPIDGSGGPPLDDSFRVADVYSDGFAKVVHCAQPDNSAAAVADGELPPASDLGIEIGWDDGQVTGWQNDQLTLQIARATSKLSTTSVLPLGVLGYRVDVADVTPASPGGPFKTPVWQSLCNVATTLPSGLGTFTGDLCVEPVPVQPYSATASDAWLPRYFALWRGGSLCEPDPVPNALTNPKNPAVTPLRTAVGLTTLLSYGHTYSFRVRLGDLSNGGPQLVDAPVNPGPGSVGSQTFQRLVPPKAPLVQQLDSGGKTITPQPGVPSAPATLVVGRPMITYPEVLYTHLGDTAAARTAIRNSLVASAKSSTTPIAGLPDPDVNAVAIEVAVRHPLHDTGTDKPFVTLYTTSRALNPITGTPPLGTDPGTSIPVIFIDEPSIVEWSPGGQPLTGPLLIPRGRDVQITLRAQLRTDEPVYFAPQSLQAMASTILTRVEPLSEVELLSQADTTEPVTGYLFRRPPGVDAPPLVEQLAQELGVVSNGNSLCAPTGMRISYGAARALRTQISGDGETLTFGSTSELLRYWIVAIVLDLERDWTWTGLTAGGLTILRGGPTDTETTAMSVGAVTIPPVLGTSATTRATGLDRSRTRIIFLDAVDPHEPTTSGFPESLQHRWFVKPNRTPAGPPVLPTPPAPVYKTPPLPLTGTDFADAPLDLRLPIAIPPTQVPAIASVGLALSPYQVGPLYSSTGARQRALWIELTEAIDNTNGDALFARVLSHGADPILYAATAQVVPDANPPLPLDPELVRQIIPSDTDDRAGLNAMQQLIPAPGSAKHFMLPLPPGMSADDPELFGFWTYELRVGHSGKPGDLRWWSTANGRFGSALRVVGVQHPAPGLVCHPGRVNVAAAKSAAILKAITAPASPFAFQQVLAPLLGNVTAAGGTPSLIIATASYASPVLNGTPLTKPSDAPLTTMWFLIYAQAVQADGTSMRNVLIAAEPGVFVTRKLGTIDPVLEPYFDSLVKNAATGRDRISVAAFHQSQVEAILSEVHLPASAPLSMIAVEMLRAGTGQQVGAAGSVPMAPPRPTDGNQPVVNYPFGRILRVSPLATVAAFC
jgi:hypothetical protein